MLILRDSADSVVRLLGHGLILPAIQHAIRGASQVCITTPAALGLRLIGVRAL